MHRSSDGVASARNLVARHQGERADARDFVLERPGRLVGSRSDGIGTGIDLVEQFPRRGRVVDDEAVASVVVSDRLLFGIVAILLLRILDVLIDVRNSLDERPAGEPGSPESSENSW